MKKSFTVIIVSLLLSACGVTQNYNALETLVRNNDCKGAVEYIKNTEQTYGDNARLLFLLDSAMIHMQCGNYDQSNTFFHEAEDLSESLWTESITKNVASMVTSDLVLPYSGEDFERALINLFSAINYIRKGEPDEALVECRRLDSLLSIYNSRYEAKNIYKEDAFARYLSGIIHEADNELDDAYIDYYSSYKIYTNDYRNAYGTPTPITLTEDLLRMAESVDRLDEAFYTIPGSRSMIWSKKRETDKLGKMVFVHFNGRAPVKMDRKFIVPTNSGPVSIAFPEYRVSVPPCRNSTLVLESDFETFEADTTLAEDINRIAVKCLADRKARIWVKAIARAIAKQVAIQAAANQVEDQAGSDLLKWGLNIINTIAVEKADTRSWHTLPGEIYFTRLFVPPGDYHAFARLCSGQKRAVSPVSIKAGETKFIVFYTIY